MSSSRTLRRQARAEATLRTAPEASVLREMLLQAVSDRDVAIKAATGAAHGVTAAVNKAGPTLRRVYGGAINAAHGTSATVDATLAGMGAPASPIQAAMARERGTGADRLSASLAAALSENSNRRIEAAAGRAQATNAALTEYGATKSKLTRQALDLANQSGLYASTRLGELTDAERKARRDAHEKALTRRAQAVQNALSRKNSRLTAGVDAQGKVIPGGAKDKTAAGAKPLTAAEQRARGKAFVQAKDQITKVRAYIKDLSAPDKRGRPANDPATIKHYLVQGAQFPIAIKDPATGQKKSVTRKIPAFDSTFVNAAFDLEQQGYLSAQTVHDLRAAKIHVPKNWLPTVTVKSHTRRRATRQVTNNAVKSAQQIAAALGKIGK